MVNDNVVTRSSVSKLEYNSTKPIITPQRDSKLKKMMNSSSVMIDQKSGDASSSKQSGFVSKLVRVSDKKDAKSFGTSGEKKIGGMRSGEKAYATTSSSKYNPGS